MIRLNPSDPDMDWDKHNEDSDAIAKACLKHWNRLRSTAALARMRTAQEKSILVEKLYQKLIGTWIKYVYSEKGVSKRRVTTGKHAGDTVH